MDESDSSSEREATTTCSPPFIRGRLRRRKAPERDFKETKKTKLNGSAAKRFFQKIKQKFTARRLRRKLKKTEVAPLLTEDSYGSGSDSGTATVDTDRRENKPKRTKSAKKSVKEKKLDPFSAIDAQPLLDEGDESDDESSEGVGQGEEFEEIDLDSDVSQEVRTGKKWTNKDSMEIEEVVSDKKRRQIEARRLRRQKKKVPLIIPSTPQFCRSIAFCSRNQYCNIWPPFCSPKYTGARHSLML